MSISVEVFYSVDDLDQTLISKWRELEINALQFNAYLSPNFTIPALKNLNPDIDIAIFTVTQLTNNGNKLIGLAVFKIISPTLKYPFYYLKSYQSAHSFSGGVLLDNKYYKVAMCSLFSHIKKLNQWSGIQLSNFQFISEYSVINNALLSENIYWFEFFRLNRAILYPKSTCQEFLNTNLSRKNLKDIRRRKRNLQKLGDITWRVVFGKKITDTIIEDFLNLEYSGWKGQEGSALKSDKSSEVCFKKIVNNFIEFGDVFFTEIRLNDKAIASTCNFISGDTGFAFKLGWDRDYEKYSIGYMNEIEFILNFPKKLNSLTHVDSGAMPKSFINKLWVDKIQLVSGMYSLNKRALFYLKTIFLLKTLFKKITCNHSKKVS